MPVNTEAKLTSWWEGTLAGLTSAALVRSPFLLLDSSCSVATFSFLSAFSVSPSQRWARLAWNSWSRAFGCQNSRLDLDWTFISNWCLDWFRNLKTKLEPSGMKNSLEKFSSSEYSSPKRKIASSSVFLPLTAEPSPSKKRKLNFHENLSFWRKMEVGENAHSQHGPKNSVVRKFESENTHTKKQDNLDVVIRRDKPESERGILSGGSQGEGTYIKSAAWGDISMWTTVGLKRLISII